MPARRDGGQRAGMLVGLPARPGQVVAEPVHGDGARLEAVVDALGRAQPGCDRLQITVHHQVQVQGRDVA